MDNKAIFDQSAPSIVRRQDTSEYTVLLLKFDTVLPFNEEIYESLASCIEKLFYPKNQNRAEERKRITKLEACWLPRRSYDLEGFPQTILLDETNAYAILRLIVLRQGTDIIEVTLETDEEKKNKLSPNY
jgi:hypothetical protein